MTLKYEHLIGIPFTGIGKRDCYALAQDFFWDNFQMKFTDYARPHDWKSDSVDLIRQNYEREGFKMITEWSMKDLRPADVLALFFGESNPNHLAIWLGEQGKDSHEILHHIYGRMSRAEPFGFWRNQVSFILRHPDIPDLRPVYPDIDIMDLIRAKTAPPTR